MSQKEGSYLDKAVIELPNDAENAQLYAVIETDVVEPSSYDADNYAERKYRRDNQYDGPLISVTEEVDDGFHVSVMEQTCQDIDMGEE